MRLGHVSHRTEQAYPCCMRGYHEFNPRKDPALFGAERVTAFLNHLATDLDVSASTQSQPLSALLFLYREVLRIDLPWLDELVRAKLSKRLPVVLSRDQIRAVIGQLDGAPRLMAALLYGSGLRLMECCRLPVKDVDFGRSQLVVREGKGDQDRVTSSLASLHAPLRAQLLAGRAQHRADLSMGAGWVELPRALDRKQPWGGQSWPWQSVFPATRTYVDRLTGRRRRHHLHETALQRAVRTELVYAGLASAADLSWGDEEEFLGRWVVPQARA